MHESQIRILKQAIEARVSVKKEEGPKPITVDFIRRQPADVGSEHLLGEAKVLSERVVDPERRQ